MVFQSNFFMSVERLKFNLILFLLICLFAAFNKFIVKSPEGRSHAGNAGRFKFLVSILLFATLPKHGK